ncbi:hypothetical protein P872_19110 [Rhodonellum psychrophilum GCM71 = DSM 17998]|uniref:Uncharacterized protein n=1 Tax=Rhodonellum psychrophilum GCM71 = DSM 17998 TaxID=1123057 RepID=U5BMM6_9BACT|nr:hypothetical protein P872_19110 [Rhodonellum psychrophilum GCM71 = DSM 17998]
MNWGYFELWDPAMVLIVKCSGLSQTLVPQQEALNVRLWWLRVLISYHRLLDLAIYRCIDILAKITDTQCSKEEVLGLFV